MKENNNHFLPATKVYRTQIIEGVSIPAFIRNGNYHFIDLDVYEDGRVNCWNFEDLEHFKKDVYRGWVSLSVPKDESISINGLGCWTVDSASWTFDNNSFIEYVLSLIKTLNPEMDNIFTYRQKVINGVRIGESGTGTIYKPYSKHPNNPFPEKIKGDSINLFYKVEEEYYLIKVTVYADLTINLGRLEKPLDVSFSELEELVEKKIVVTELPSHAKVAIYGLGNFTVSENDYVMDIHQKLLEIKDMLSTLKGEPDSITVCRQAYQQYIDNPTLENKELLRISYENVPEHNQMYVGDMDTKDIPVRMIIYGEQEIENWSHYRVAKRRGESLPVIKIPRPKDASE